MKVLNEPLIEKFIRKHADARSWLENWLMVARNARWETIQEIKRSYPSADGGVRVGSGAKVTVFDVSGNKYRLITDVNFAVQSVTVLAVMPHAEYSKSHWKDRY
jgi:mRNA interferase HigB